MNSKGTRQAEVEAAMRRLNEQLATVVEIEHALAAAFDQSLIFEILRNGIQQLFPDAATLFVSRFDSTRQWIEAVYGFADGQELDVSSLPGIPLAPPGQGNQSQVIHTRQPVVINSGLKGSIRPQTLVCVGAANDRETQSAVYVPMLARDQVVGVIQVQTYTPDRFNSQDIRAMTLVANTAAVALLNVRLYETAQKEINERKQVEAALRQSESRLHAAQAIGKIGNWEYDPASGLLTFSSQMFGLFKLDPAQEHPSLAQVLMLFHPDDAPVVREFFQRALQTGEGWEHDARVLQPDGSTVWHHGAAVVDVNDQGEVFRIRGTTQDITERKQAEDAVRESHKTAQALLNASTDVFFLMNIDGTIIAANEAMGATLGKPVSGLIGANVYDLLPGNISTSRKLRLAEALQTRRPLRFEDQGERGWVENTIYPIVEPDGTVRRAAIYGRNITERKKAEIALSASEEKYRGLIESLDSLVAAVDADGQFLYVNEMAAEQYGRSADELVGHKMGDLFPENITARQLQHIRQVIETDQRLVYEHLSMMGAMPRWYRTTIEPIHDANKRVVYALLNTTDIHSLKSTQQELEALNHTLEQRVRQRTAEVQDLYENAPIGYHSLDTNGCVMLINQTELSWLGYTHDEVVGRPYSDFISPSSRPAFLASYEIFKQVGAGSELEYELVRKDGSIFPALASRTAIFDDQGQYLRSRSAVFDNTRRKAAEEALRRANLDLEQAMRLKNEFLANMSHELRTPLNGILGFAQILLTGFRGPLNLEQQKYVRLIEQSGQRLQGLISDLFDIARIEAGELVLHPEPVEIAEICQASLAAVQEAARQKNIAISYLPDPAAQRLQVDRLRLKQILVNLLSNAVKFTPAAGQVGLQVQAIPQNNAVQFIVSDTGIGIAPENLQLAFSPFVQVDGSLSRPQEGAGLGLALVKRLVELHGGSVAVESEPGAGSRFYVRLPWLPETETWHLLEPQADWPPVRPAADTGAALEPAALESRGTILLAEDNEMNLMAVGDFLQSIGYQMVYARDGAEALAMAQTNPPDLILMDIQMPVMDGLQATRRLRAEARFTATPIVALTALAMPGDRERCLEAGANDYLSKPVRLVDLERLVTELIDKV